MKIFRLSIITTYINIFIIKTYIIFYGISLKKYLYLIENPLAYWICDSFRILISVINSVFTEVIKIFRLLIITGYINFYYAEFKKRLY